VDNLNGTFLTFRCENQSAHFPKEGNVVAFLGKNSIIVRCNDSHCRHWNKIEFNFGNINIDLRKVGIVQAAIRPGTMKLDSLQATVIVDGEAKP